MKMQKIYLVGGRGNGLKALKVKKKVSSIIFQDLRTTFRKH
jgi:hypothetical protein